MTNDETKVRDVIDRWRIATATRTHRRDGGLKPAATLMIAQGT
jgi:hypothetical protein